MAPSSGYVAGMVTGCSKANWPAYTALIAAIVMALVRWIAP